MKEASESKKKEKGAAHKSVKKGAAKARSGGLSSPACPAPRVPSQVPRSSSLSRFPGGQHGLRQAAILNHCAAAAYQAAAAFLFAQPGPAGADNGV